MASCGYLNVKGKHVWDGVIIIKYVMSNSWDKNTVIWQSEITVSVNVIIICISKFLNNYRVKLSIDEWKYKGRKYLLI